MLQDKTQESHVSKGIKPVIDQDIGSAENSFSTQRAGEASVEQGILASTSKSITDLDKEFQTKNPDVKPDEDFEADVTCATPGKYIM